MPDFPLDELTIRDGVLTLVNPSLPQSEYLDTPPLRITTKDKLVELASGDVSYMFALNHGADATWIELFATHLGGLSAEIQGSQVDIRCAPAELERAFVKVKEALARTNRNYAEVKAQLSERVAELDVERRTAQRAAEERSRALRDQFDRLEL